MEFKVGGRKFTSKWKKGWKAEVYGDYVFFHNEGKYTLKELVKELIDTMVEKMKVEEEMVEKIGRENVENLLKKREEIVKKLTVLKELTFDSPLYVLEFDDDDEMVDYIDSLNQPDVAVKIMSKNKVWYYFNPDVLESEWLRRALEKRNQKSEE